MATDYGFIGLGNMGFQMAGNIRKKIPSSTTLHVFDVAYAASEHFVKSFGSFGPIHIARTSKEVAEKSQTIVSMVPNSDNARDVYLNPQHGIIAAIKDANRLMLECSTIEVKATQDIGKEIMDAGLGIYLDTPVSGGTAGAAAATLSFMVGFETRDQSSALGKRIQEVLHLVGAPEKTTFCGGLGSGLICKIVNNYIGLSNIVTAAQGMALGIKHGVDKMTLYKCIKGSSGDSWVMDFAQPVPGIHSDSASTNGFRPSFAPRLCVKDVGLALETASEVGVAASMGEAALKVFAKTNDDPRTTNLDCSSIWLHVSHEIDNFKGAST